MSIDPASLPIDDARGRVADLLARVLRGEDPTADRRMARIAAAEARAKPKPLVLTVGQVWSAWMAGLGGRDAGYWWWFKRRHGAIMMLLIMIFNIDSSVDLVASRDVTHKCG